MGRYSIIVALLFGLSACAAEQSDIIYLGLAAPIGSPAGEGAQRGALLAVEEINSNGGINGRTLELEIKDDEMERERAIRVATEFRDEGRVVAVIGHINSGATLAAADIYNHPVNGLLEISPGATSPELTGKGAWTFRVCPTDLHQASALADWAYTRLDLRRAAVLYVNDEYGRGVLHAFAPTFEKLGGRLIAQDPFLASVIDSETALDPYIQRAILGGVDALVIAGVGEDALYVLRAARRLGYQGAVMGADGLTDLKDAGPIAEGVFMVTGFLPDKQTESAQAFVQHYVEHFNELPRDGAAHTYDAVMLVAQGLREVGADRRALRDYIAAVGTDVPQFEGVTGTIRLDANGDVVDKEMAIGVIRSGEYVTVH